MIDYSVLLPLAPDLTQRVHFALGENDQGFKWLERSYEERVPGMKRLKIDQEYDSVGSDPRFKALLKKMNFE